MRLWDLGSAIQCRGPRVGLAACAPTIVECSDGKGLTATPGHSLKFKPIDSMYFQDPNVSETHEILTQARTLAKLVDGLTVLSQPPCETL